LKSGLLSIIGFSLFIIGFLALILTLIGLHLGFLGFIEKLGPLGAFLVKILMIAFGLILVYTDRTKQTD